MKADYNALRNLVAQQGADWFVTNREELAGREREEFAAWLRTSPVHIEEYLAIAAMSQDLREACADWADSVDTLVSRPARDTEDPQTELWPGAAKRPSSARIFFSLARGGRIARRSRPVSSRTVHIEGNQSTQNRLQSMMQ